MSDPNYIPSIADDRTAGGGIADASNEAPPDRSGTTGMGGNDDGEDLEGGPTRADLSILTDAFDEGGSPHRPERGAGGLDEMVSGRFGSDVSDDVEE